MDLELRGRRAVVTGGASNIGRAISLTLAAEGARVAVLDIDATAGERTASAAGGCFQQVDVTDAAGVDRAFASAEVILGGLDIVVVAAGGPSTYAPFTGKDRAEWRRDVDLNYWGAVHSLTAAMPRLQDAGGGRVVVIASEAGLQPSANGAAYGSAKAAVIALAKSLALEYAPDICVNSVCPYFSPPADASEFGPLSRWGAGGGSEYWTPERRAALLARVPLGRAGTAQDIANLVAFLAGERAAFITGQTWSVNGGANMR